MSLYITGVMPKRTFRKNSADAPSEVAHSLFIPLKTAGDCRTERYEACVKLKSFYSIYNLWKNHG